MGYHLVFFKTANLNAVKTVLRENFSHCTKQAAFSLCECLYWCKQKESRCKWVYQRDNLCTLPQTAYNILNITLKVLNFWKFTSYYILKPLWSGMGEVMPARTSPTLHPPSPPTVHQLSRLALQELIRMRYHWESLQRCTNHMGVWWRYNKHLRI